VAQKHQSSLTFRDNAITYLFIISLYYYYYYSILVPSIG